MTTYELASGSACASQRLALRVRFEPSLMQFDPYKTWAAGRGLTLMTGFSLIPVWRLSIFACALYVLNQG